MKRLLLGAGALILCAVILFAGVSAYLTVTMPAYQNSVGDDNHTEKITGLYLVRQSAAREDNLIIYGSSELRTREISTHPANFFAGRRSGFQVNLVGRGSCQSLIHAINIAATGEALRGQKVVLITSPQSYVEEGIAPDLFVANFSELQYLELLLDPELTAEVKAAISARVLELWARYEAMEGGAAPDPALRWLAEHHADPNTATAARNAVLSPYYSLSRTLLDLDDRAASRRLLNTLETPPASNLSPIINWQDEADKAVAAAERLTANNEFGMLDDYYTTYIGERLSRQAGRDSDLSYSHSREYDDLRLLLEVCRQKGIEPLFVHVPLHGAWSDYTGFAAERRQDYYDKVRAIVEGYDVRLLDLTGYEYEAYFLCDVMHLGWKGWLEVDRALVDYYYDR